MEFWRVGSYGYPTPFAGTERADHAWQMLTSFANAKKYSQVKGYWESGAAQRVVDPHAVESWKTTFEEMGLLYVIAGTDIVVVTPGGAQLFKAAGNQDERAFAWVGLNLLLRTPLRWIRGPRAKRFEDSDLLLYWCLHASLRDLRNHLWHTELVRVVIQLIRAADAPTAIQSIEQLRSSPGKAAGLVLPAADPRTLYNYANQVVNHAGLNSTLLDLLHGRSPYQPNERMIRIPERWIGMVDLALGGSPSECTDAHRFIDRMPSVDEAVFESEEAFFDYLGAPVPAESSVSTQPAWISLGGEQVLLLRAVDYAFEEELQRITGPISSLCQVATGKRLILEHDLTRTFIADAKQRLSDGSIAVTVRRARPIVDRGPIEERLGANL